MSARSENPKNEKDDASATKKELERLFPEESGPVDLYEGYPYELETFSIVWYKHRDKGWSLALALGPAKSMRPSYGKEVWLGLISPSSGLTGMKEKEHVYLCPEVGNALPDSPYTRTLLKLSGKIPNDDARIQKWVDNFKENILINK